MIVNYKVISLSPRSTPQFGRVTSIVFNTILKDTGRSDRLTGLIEGCVDSNNLYDLFDNDLNGSDSGKTPMAYVFSVLTSTRLGFSKELCQELYGLMKTVLPENPTPECLSKSMVCIQNGAKANFDEFLNSTEGSIQHFFWKNLHMSDLIVAACHNKMGQVSNSITDSITDTAIVIRDVENLKSDLFSEVETIISADLRENGKSPEVIDEIMEIFRYKMSRESYTELMAWCLTCDEEGNDTRREHIKSNTWLYRPTLITRLLNEVDRLYVGTKTENTFKRNVVQGVRQIVLELLKDPEHGVRWSDGYTHKDLDGGDLVILRDRFKTNKAMALWALFLSTGHHESMGTRKGINPEHQLLSMAALKAIYNADSVVIFFSKAHPESINYTTFKGHYDEAKKMYMLSIGQQIVDDVLRGKGHAKVVAVTGINWMYSNCTGAPEKLSAKMRLNFKTTHPATVKEAIAFYPPKDSTLPDSADTVGRMVRAELEALSEEDAESLEEKGLIYIQEGIRILRLLPFLYSDNPVEGLGAMQNLIDSIVNTIEFTFYSPYKVCSLTREKSWVFGPRDGGIKLTLEELESFDFCRIVDRVPVIDIRVLQEKLTLYKEATVESASSKEEQLLKILQKRLEVSSKRKIAMRRLESEIEKVESHDDLFAKLNAEKDIEEVVWEVVRAYFNVAEISPFIRSNQVRFFSGGIGLLANIQSQFPNPGDPTPGKKQTAAALYQDMSCNEAGADTFLLSHDYATANISQAAIGFKMISDQMGKVKKACVKKDRTLRDYFLKELEGKFNNIDSIRLYPEKLVFPPTVFEPLDTLLSKLQTKLKEAQVRMNEGVNEQVNKGMKRIHPSMKPTKTDIDAFCELKRSATVLTNFEALCNALKEFTEEKVRNALYDNRKQCFYINGKLLGVSLDYVNSVCSDPLVKLFGAEAKTVFLKVLTRVHDSAAYFTELET